MFNVDVDGRPYQEMHVDGSTVSQGFLYPPTVSVTASDSATGFQKQRIAYIIWNSRPHTDWEEVERKTIDVAAKAVSTMISYNGAGDLLPMYLTARRDGVAFNLAYVGDDFTVEHKVEFDQSYMRALYDYGYKLGVAGYKWKNRPAGFIEKPSQTAFRATLDSQAKLIASNPAKARAYMHPYY
jgi:hypothetical protein